MKQIFAVAACWAALTFGAAATEVGVSIQFSQPGVFGRVDIGQFPQPQVVVAQPVIIAPPPGAMPPPEPVYLWVPMEHRKHWDRYCAQYHACGHPVYFVNHVWYREHVLAHQGHPEARHEEEGHREHGHSGEAHEHQHGHDEDEHGHGHN